MGLNMKNKLIIIFFVAILIAVPLVSYLSPDLQYSEQEKRNLLQFSDINITSYKNLSKIDKQVEKYLTDQFPFRDNLVTVRTISDVLVGKKEVSKVYIGKNGYLMDTFSNYDKKMFKNNLKNHRKLSEELKKLKIPFQMLLVPSAVEILDNKCPAYVSCQSQEKLIKELQREIPEMLNICPVLRKHKNEYIYYKSDHHWTSLGAYYAYAAWRKAQGLEVQPISSWKHEALCNNFRGTTWAKTGLPGKWYYDRIDGYFRTKNYKTEYNFGTYKTNNIYEEKYLKGKDQYGVFFNSNQVVTKISGRGKKGKLLIIKDSYANTFTQFVLDDYKEVQMVDMRFFRGSIASYIKQQKFTNVLALYGCTGFATENKRL